MRRLALLVVLAGATVVPGVAEADSTIYVGTAPDCPNAQFSDLTTAVIYAQPHDTIRICPGTYTVGPTTPTVVPGTGLQGLVVDKTLQIIGAGASKVTIEPTQSLALAGSPTDNVRDGLGNVIDVTNSSPGDSSDFDVNPTISGVTISDGGFLVDAGIAFNNAAGSITNSTIGPFTGSRPTVGDPNVGWGVVASNNYAVTPQGTFVRDVTVSGDLITGYGGGGVLIDGSESTKPIYFRSGVSTTGAITGNVITGAGSTSIVQQYGIQVNAGARAAITGNVISANQGATAATATSPGSGVAVLLTDADLISTVPGSPTSYYTTIGSNDLTGNGYGIFNGTADFPGAYASDSNDLYPIEVNGTAHTPTDLPTLTNTAQSTATAPVSVDYDVPGFPVQGAQSKANYYGTTGPVVGAPSTVTADGISESTAGGSDSVIYSKTASGATSTPPAAAYPAPTAPGVVTDAPPTAAWGTPDGTYDTTLQAGTANELLVQASDDFGVQSVDINASGTDLGTLTLPPYETTWTPPTSLAGQTVPLLATVTDEAGQVTTTTIDVTVVAPSSGPASPPGSPGSPVSTGGGSNTPPTIALAASFGTSKQPITSLSFKPTFTGAIASVVYKLDGKVICTTKVAPFACSAKLTGADPGTHKLEIVATSSSGIVTTFERTIHIARIAAKGLTVKTSAKGGKLRVTGTLVRPANVTAAEGCSAGKVTLAVAHHRATVKLGAKCTFSAKLSGVANGAKLKASFGGNAVLDPRSHTVKAA
jgi:large repetitive protein